MRRARTYRWTRMRPYRAGSEGRAYSSPSNPGRAASPIYSDLICDRHSYLINMSKAKRTGKIFLDYLRNDQFSTAVAPLSPRARPNAPVSMPVTWPQVRHGLDPAEYTIHTVPQLLRKSKAWADYCEGERSPLEAIARLRKPQVVRRAA